MTDHTEDERDETYSVAQIREAFRKHAGQDDWGVKNFTEDEMVAALRGRFDESVPDCDCGADAYGPGARHLGKCAFIRATA